MKLRRGGVRERGFGELAYTQLMRLKHGWPADAFDSVELELLAWAEHRERLLKQSREVLPWAYWRHELGEQPPYGDDPRDILAPRPAGPGADLYRTTEQAQRERLLERGEEHPVPTPTAGAPSR